MRFHDRLAWVDVTAPMKQQLHFWWLLIKTTDGVSSIPAPDRFPAWTFEFHTDASGGSSLFSGHGIGGVGGPFWLLVPWGSRINSGMRAEDGKRLNR